MKTITRLSIHIHQTDKYLVDKFTLGKLHPYTGILIERNGSDMITVRNV